jgi:ATP-binding cassette subfamily D (ALD) long-chain fatty acid import protein
MKYHTQVLTLAGDGLGGWSLMRVSSAEERMGVEREIVTLQDKLAEVDEWGRRLTELNVLLGAQGHE